MFLTCEKKVCRKKNFTWKNFDFREKSSPASVPSEPKDFLCLLCFFLMFFCVYKRISLGSDSTKVLRTSKKSGRFGATSEPLLGPLQNSKIEAGSDYIHRQYVLQLFRHLLRTIVQVARQ